MFTGHLAIGFAGKHMEPKISLGTWMTAAILADLFAFVFMMAGIERFRPISGVAANRMLGEIPYSHSLLTDTLWALLFAAGFYLWRRSARGALLLSAAVLSHWVLDVVSHRPDMALAPGVKPLLGSGTMELDSSDGAGRRRRLARRPDPLRAGHEEKELDWRVRILVGIALLTVSWLGNITAGIRSQSGPRGPKRPGLLFADDRLGLLDEPRPLLQNIFDVGHRARVLALAQPEHGLLANGGILVAARHLNQQRYAFACGHLRQREHRPSS